MVPFTVCEAIHQGPLASVTAGGVHQLEMHQQGLLEFRAHTKRIIRDCLERDEVLHAVQHAHALGVNDNRLHILREDLVTLDRLGTGIVQSIGTWSRHFGHLAVDVDKSVVCRDNGLSPRAVFIWIGRDMVERIQTESEALSTGNPYAAGESSRNFQAYGSSLQTLPSTHNFAQKVSPSPLVSLAMASQKFKVSDVLHAGPPPTWYDPQIAKAGIAAIRRGIPCGGGDKRV